MAVLTEAQKEFIVCRLAEYRRPTEVVEDVRTEFGIEIRRQQVSDYDPRVRHRKPLAAKWKTLFEKARTAYQKDLSDIPIAQRAYRLRTLNDLASKAIAKGNAPLAASLMEQAAKEAGDAFTNRTIINHKGKIDTSPNERAARIETLLAKLTSGPEKVKAE